MDQLLAAVSSQDEAKTHAIRGKIELIDILLIGVEQQVRAELRLKDELEPYQPYMPAEPHPQLASKEDDDA